MKAMYGKCWENKKFAIYWKDNIRIRGILYPNSPYIFHMLFIVGHLCFDVQKYNTKNDVRYCLSHKYKKNLKEKIYWSLKTDKNNNILISHLV